MSFENLFSYSATQFEIVLGVFTLTAAVFAVWYLFVVSWTIYPVAYLMPQIWDDQNGVVARNLIYSFADISSKAVYGVLLAAIAQKLSAEQGYQEAIDSASWVEPDHADSHAG